MITIPDTLSYTLHSTHIATNKTLDNYYWYYYITPSMDPPKASRLSDSLRDVPVRIVHWVAGSVDQWFYTSLSNIRVGQFPIRTHY